MDKFKSWFECFISTVAMAIISTVFFGYQPNPIETVILFYVFQIWHKESK